ncbi:MAG: right-handed parallel beta-helix repeat-containing protein, partial [Candidatus Woesearchaeota archaeon]
TQNSTIRNNSITKSTFITEGGTGILVFRSSALGAEQNPRNITIQNNRISNSTSVGINVIRGDIVSVLNNDLTNIFRTGIQLTDSNNSIVRENNITRTARGVIVTTAINPTSFNNIVENNFISTFNTSTGNFGIAMATAVGTIIRNNIIFTNGTGGSNYGIYLAIDNSNNTIESNTISTNGPGAFNLGIIIIGGPQNNVTNNIITTNGTGGNYGILLWPGTNFTRVLNNTITTSGNETFNPAISIEGQSSFNVISYNTIIRTGDFSNNTGILLLNGASFNNITNNNISLITGENSDAIRIETPTSVGNLISTNTIANFTGQAIRIIDATNNTIENMNITKFSMQSTNNATINWSQTIEITTQRNLADVVTLAANLTKVNTTLAPELNKSARIELNTTSTANSYPFFALDDVTFQPCFPPRCTDISFNNSTTTLIFNVSSWTSYSGGQQIEGVNISTSSTSASIIAGSDATFLITVGNNGTKTSTYNLTVQNLQGAATASLNASNITLNAGTTGTALLTVSNPAQGIFGVTVTALLSTNASINATTPVITVTIAPAAPPSKGGRISPAQPDSSPPIITYISPTPPHEAVLNTTTLMIRVLVEDESDIASVSLEFGTQKYAMTSLNGQWLYTLSGLGDGLYSYRVSAVDVYGNRGISAMRTVRILTQLPAPAPEVPVVEVPAVRRALPELPMPEVIPVPINLAVVLPILSYALLVAIALALIVKLIFVYGIHRQPRVGWTYAIYSLIILNAGILAYHYFVTKELLLPAYISLLVLAIISLLQHFLPLERPVSILLKEAAKKSIMAGYSERTIISALRARGWPKEEAERAVRAAARELMKG